MKKHQPDTFKNWSFDPQALTIIGPARVHDSDLPRAKQGFLGRKSPSTIIAQLGCCDYGSYRCYPLELARQHGAAIAKVPQMLQTIRDCLAATKAQVRTLAAYEEGNGGSVADVIESLGITAAKLEELVKE